jgi:GLEYA domain
MPKQGKGISLVHLKSIKLSPNITYLNGLYGKRYSGYFGVTMGNNDNVNWFATATRSTGTSAPHYDEESTSDFTLFSSSPDYTSYDNYSWQWLGYFKAPSTDNYIFKLQSDDASYLWVGNNAKNGFTRDNATVNCGGLRGYTAVTGSPISLVGGIYYPVRIQYGENQGGDKLTLSYHTSTNSGTEISNFAGKFFHITNQDFSA